MPATVAVPNGAALDDSDDNVSLDLHVSDPEDCDGANASEKDKASDEVPMEVEDELLNKFDLDLEESTTTTPTVAPVVNGTAEPDDAKVAEAKVTDIVETKVTEVVEAKVTEVVDRPDEAPTNKTETTEGEDFLQVMEEKTTEEDETDFINDTENGVSTSENGEESSSGGKEKEDGEPASGEASPSGIASPTSNVVEDSTAVDDGNATDDGNAIEDGNLNLDETMDIEECGLEGTIIATHNVVETPDGLNIVVEEKVDAVEKEVEEAAAIKVAVEVESEKSVLESILVSSTAVAVTKTLEPSTKPVNKRLLPETADEEEPLKKPKLVDGGEKRPDDTDDNLKKLGSFRQYMKDKSLKGLTRDQLEIFCVQKMCECIVQKSEIGELKMKIKMHEQMLDLLRKEAVLLGKQTRDLNIVHQKVIQDVGRINVNPDKPLIIPKITRSVGLQAVVRDEASKRRQVVNKATPNNRSPRVAPVATTPTNRAVQNTTNRYPSTAPKPTTPLTARLAQPPKTNVAIASKPPPPPLVAKTPEQRSNGVIDLTDEDDKRTTTTTAAASMPPLVAQKTATAQPQQTPPAPNGTKLNLINNANGQRLVVMPNGQTVMVKLATTNSLVVTQPILRTVQQNSAPVVRTINSNQVLRTVSQPVRMGMSPSGRGGGRGGGQTVRARAPYSVQQQAPKQNKHPAPLPNPPAVKPDVYSMKPVPPKPLLMLNKTQCGSGIVLSWKMPYNLDMFEVIASYQLYAYQETKSEPRTDSWGKIGDVKALELPMAVTLTQFAVGNRYYFAVRAVDVLTRHGAFSDYQTILL